MLVPKLVTMTAEFADRLLIFLFFRSVCVVLVITALMCLISTCTRPSAFLMVEEDLAWARLECESA